MGVYSNKDADGTHLPQWKETRVTRLFCGVFEIWKALSILYSEPLDGVVLWFGWGCGCSKWSVAEDTEIIASSQSLAPHQLAPLCRLSPQRPQNAPSKWLTRSETRGSTWMLKFSSKQWTVRFRVLCAFHTHTDSFDFQNTRCVAGKVWMSQRQGNWGLEHSPLPVLTVSLQWPPSLTCLGVSRRCSYCALSCRGHWLLVRKKRSVLIRLWNLACPCHLDQTQVGLCAQLPLCSGAWPLWISNIRE